MYIHFAMELSHLESVIHEEDEPKEEGGDVLQVVICMSPESSYCLLEAQFLQSDIGFKRIVGFMEFELGGRDGCSHTSELTLSSCVLFG